MAEERRSDDSHLQASAFTPPATHGRTLNKHKICVRAVDMTDNRVAFVRYAHARMAAGQLAAVHRVAETIHSEIRAGAEHAEA